MATLTVEVGTKEIKEVFKRLPSRERINLVEELIRQTRKERWENLFQDVRGRIKKHPISDQEIQRICEEVRKKHYERNKGSY